MNVNLYKSGTNVNKELKDDEAQSTLLEPKRVFFKRAFSLRLFEMKLDKKCI